MSESQIHDEDKSEIVFENYNIEFDNLIDNNKMALVMRANTYRHKI